MAPYSRAKVRPGIPEGYQYPTAKPRCDRSGERAQHIGLIHGTAGHCECGFIEARVINGRWILGPVGTPIDECYSYELPAGER